MNKLAIFLLGFVFFLGCKTKTNEEQIRPNLLIIQTDEHNFRTVGCYRDLMSEDQAYIWGEGIKVETPNLDRIAEEGTICTNFYASSPVCTPSRASFQTGLYPVATGAPINGMSMFHHLKTFADVLKQDGYATSYVGKWHLYGHRPEGVSEEEHIKAFGYDDYKWRFESGHAKWVVPNDSDKFKLTYAEPDIEDPDLYVTDFLTNRALEVLERDKNKPFCLMLSLPNPHSPDIAREPYKSRYAELDAKAPETMDPNWANQRPGWGIGGKSESGDFDVNSVREYFGMVKCIDDNVGRVLQFLDDNNLTENTIVVFTSDHGDLLFEHHRINKDMPYEASANIPFLIRWPGNIKAGKVVEKPYTTCDFPNTILGIMNQEQLENVHGINDAEMFLKDEAPADPNRVVYFTDSPFSEWTAATDGHYKLVLSCKDTPWLFDLENDPNELINLYSDPEYKSIAESLQTELVRQMKLYRDPALDLGLNYCYSANDEVTYVGPYNGKTPQEIKKIENEVLQNSIAQIMDKCYNEKE